MTGVIVATVIGLALPAGANTGHVFASQTCEAWSTSVTLDNNVAPDHFVEVTTTIPGTTGIVDAHYNTIGNSGTTQIWSASGPAPSTGTVTLTILNPNKTLDSTASASLPNANNCTTTTTTAPTTTTTAATTTTTAPTTTTTTTAPMTTTSIHEQGSTTIVTTTTSPPRTTTTLGQQGNTPTPTQPTSATGSLPRTGSGTAFPVLFGLSSLAAGALLLLRRRTDWSRS